MKRLCERADVNVCLHMHKTEKSDDDKPSCFFFNNKYIYNSFSDSLLAKCDRDRYYDIILLSAR